MILGEDSVHLDFVCVLISLCRMLVQVEPFFMISYNTTIPLQVYKLNQYYDCVSIICICNARLYTGTGIISFQKNYITLCKRGIHGPTNGFEALISCRERSINVEGLSVDLCLCVLVYI